MHEPNARRPGEGIFAAFIVIASLYLLWSAYGISGFEALSSAGAVPMATTAIMAVTGVIILAKTIRLPRADGETVRRDILPMTIVLMAVALVAYALLLRPLGFLPTSLLFLVATIRLLTDRGWLFTIGISLLSLALIYVLFRLVFTVLMPPGIVPEGQMLALFRSLF